MHTFTYTKIHKQGQSLVEMLVVVGIVVLLVTGIVSGTTLSLNRTATIQQRSAAVKYAQEGIELTRFVRDEGWDNFAAMGAVESNYCVGSEEPVVFQLTTGSCATPNINDTYTRTITLLLIPASSTTVEKMSVTVVVSWADRTQPTNAVSLVTYLTEWR
jgi:type II secretory pathway pseudopilin PulG